MKTIRTQEANNPDGAECRIRRVGVLVAAALCVWLGAGCKSTPAPPSDPLAYLEIHGHTHEQVADVTAQVFHDHGYEVRRNGWAHLVFEKPGSTMNNIAYKYWADKPVWVRVKTTIVDVSQGTCRIECEVYLLRNRNEALEEEIRVSKLHSHPYNQLLKEVAKRLSAQPAGPG